MIVVPVAAVIITASVVATATTYVVNVVAVSRWLTLIPSVTTKEWFFIYSGGSSDTPGRNSRAT